MPGERPLAAREARLRRKARRRGLRVRKCCARDPRVPGYGGYMLVEPVRHLCLLGGRPYAYAATLEEIEDFLRSYEA